MPYFTMSRIELDEQYSIMYGFSPKKLWVSYKIKYQLLNLMRSLVSFAFLPQWGRSVAGDYEIIIWLKLRHCWRVQIQNIVICGRLQYVLYAKETSYFSWHTPLNAAKSINCRNGNDNPTKVVGKLQCFKIYWKPNPKMLTEL